MRGDQYLFEHAGECPICEAEVTFVAQHSWFRDHLLCPTCKSIPRERAVMYLIEQFYPNWRSLDIFEMAPGDRGATIKLQEAPGYLASQFDPSLALGERSPHGWINQNAEALTHEDETFDLVVTQDVFEHIFDIDAALREIARVLRPGGAHIFTTPLVNKAQPTAARALRADDGAVEHLAPPEYHGNPVNPDGALVTWYFGFDLAARIVQVAKTPTIIFSLDRLDLGIQAEYIDVLVSLKNANRNPDPESC